MKTDHLPTDELKKFGILLEDNSFSKKLSQDDIRHFLNGHILLADNESKRLSFKLLPDNTLDFKLYEKDKVYNRNLSDKEIADVLETGKILYKTTKDYGTFIRKGNELNENTGEISPFIELNTEWGPVKYFATEDFRIAEALHKGDGIQVNFSGIDKTEWASPDGELLNEYQNRYAVEKSNTPEYEVKAYVYHASTRTIQEFDLLKESRELTKIIEFKNRGEKEEKIQSEYNRYNDELEKLKGFLQSKQEQYPGNERIQSDINIVAKEIRKIGSLPTGGTVDQQKEGEPITSKTYVQLNVNDYDTYEDANREKEEEEYEEEQLNRPKGYTR